MAARHMTGTEFLTQSGFGQLGVGVVASFPEYPPHNTKLTALLQRSQPGDESNVQSVVGLLLQARQLHEQGNFAGEQQALVQADRLLDQLLAGGGGRSNPLLAVLVVVALAALAWFLLQGNATPKRLPPPRRNARRPRRQPRARRTPKPVPDDEGEDDEGDADDEA